MLKAISSPTNIAPAPQPETRANQTLSPSSPFSGPPEKCRLFPLGGNALQGLPGPKPGQAPGEPHPTTPEGWGPSGRPLTCLSSCLKTHHSVNSLYLSWLPTTRYKTGLTLALSPLILSIIKWRLDSGSQPAP